MKKIISIIIIATILLTGLVGFVSSEATNLKTTKEQMTFIRPQLQETKTNTLTINNYDSDLLKQDRPLIPKQTKTFTFPYHTNIKEINIRPQNIQIIRISKPLQESPQRIALSTLQSIETSKNTIPEIYPEQWYTTNIGCGLIDDQRMKILTVDVLPVRYHIKDNYLEYAEEIDIEIIYETNPQQTRITDDLFDLLILTTDNYLSQTQPLADHKNNRGIPTKIVTLTEIHEGSYFPAQGRDNIEEIKYFIKDAIETWNITNVLIIGGAADFPARETHVQIGTSDKEIFVSDLYYADIYNGTGAFSTWDTNENDLFAEYNWEGETDTIDLYPDVRIGRLACINSEQVTTAVNKIITYENTKAYTKNWFNNIVVIGGDTVPESYGDDSETDEGERVNQFILDRMQGFIPDIIWDSNNRLSGIVPSGLENIKNGIENGCGFLDFSGHGGSWVWTTFPHNGERQTLPTPTGRYTNTIIGELTNGDMLPIVINGGCSLGKYQVDENCNAWAFIANPNGGGIASFGATGLGYIYVGEYVTEGLVEGLNIDIIEAYQDGAKTFGEMYVNGFNNYMHSNLDDGDYKTLMEWHAFGDPTLQIGEESNPPEKPNTPVGPASGKKGETFQYTTSSTDSDNDQLYYLFDWGDGTYSGWLGPFSSGEEITASKTWETQGEFEIRVRAKDAHGVQSIWSEPLIVTMSKSKVKLDKGTFIASIGLKDNEQALIELNGHYRDIRNRHLIFGTITPVNGDRTFRFQGITSRNTFIIQSAFNNRIVNMIGSFNRYDEATQTYYGQWRGNIIGQGQSNGWIKAALS